MPDSTMSHVPKAISRRDFFRWTAGAVAAASLPSTLRAQDAPAWKPIPIGTQLYCVRHELPKDMHGVLAKLAGMGYEGVEFADYFGRSAKELRALLDANGLNVCGTHIYLEDMLGDKLKETVEFNHTLGNPYLVVRSLKKEQYDTRDHFLRTAELMNEAAENLRPHGMRVGYHNHGYIFNTFDGEMLWNILADNTHKDVFLQLDTGNASTMENVDLAKLIERNAGRTVSMHVKPFSKKKPDAFLGEDELDWPKILNRAETVGGIEWYIIEYEREEHPPLQALKANLENFRRMRA